MFIIVFSELPCTFFFGGEVFCTYSLLSFEVDSPFPGSEMKVRKSCWFLVAAPPREAFFSLCGVKEVTEIIPVCTGGGGKVCAKKCCFSYNSHH